MILKIILSDLIIIVMVIITIIMMMMMTMILMIIMLSHSCPIHPLVTQGRGFNSSRVAGRSTRLQQADYQLGAFT